MTSRLLPLALLAACSDPAVPTSISGHAFDFYSSTRVPGARVTLVEFPDLVTTSAADGAWRFDGLPSGADATPFFEHPDYEPMQAATFTLTTDPPQERVTFQAVTAIMRDALAGAARAQLDPTKCQFATTVTRRGVSIYEGTVHGEAGATVTVTPEVQFDSGPVYFDAHTIPDTTLTETSTDGGVLYVNLDPGEYVFEAHKAGVTFEPVRIKCRAGVIVNASPPRGLQVL